MFYIRSVLKNCWRELSIKRNSGLFLCYNCVKILPYQYIRSVFKFVCIHCLYRELKIVKSCNRVSRFDRQRMIYLLRMNTYKVPLDASHSLVEHLIIETTYSCACLLRNTNRWIYVKYVLFCSTPMTLDSSIRNRIVQCSRFLILFISKEESNETSPRPSRSTISNRNWRN